MPERHGILVSVIEDSGMPFIEYGVQNLGSSAAKSKICSVKIESKTGKTFQILVKPKIPFPFDENEADVYTGERMTASSSSADPNSGESMKYPPFALSVEVYITGKEGPDCIHSLPLDPASPFYKPAGVVFRGRLEADYKDESSAIDPSTRSFKVRGWKWNDNFEIEELLSGISMGESDTEKDTNKAKTAEDITMDELTDDFARTAGVVKTGGGGGSSSSSTCETPGVIRVVIKRVVVLGLANSNKLPPKVGFQEGRKAKQRSKQHKAGEGHGQEVSKVNKEKDDDNHSTRPEHITGLVENDESKIKLSFVQWVQYKRREQFYAEFRFQYMPRHKLFKLGLCREDGAPMFPAKLRIVANPKLNIATKPGTGQGEQGVHRIGGRRSTSIKLLVRDRASSHSSMGKRGLEEVDMDEDDGAGAGAGAGSILAKKHKPEQEDKPEQDQQYSISI